MIKNKTIASTFLVFIMMLSIILNFPTEASATNLTTTVAGNGTYGYSGDGGPATSACLNAPNSVAVDNSGNLYFSEYGNHTVRKVNLTSGIISTVAGTGTPGYSGDGGPAASAQLKYPTAVAVDNSGNLYIADTSNKRIREVNIVSGNISTVAGNGSTSYSGDGGLATSAGINYPFDIAFDSSGNLYIAEGNNSCIRKVDKATGIISTVAGTGTAGYSGDGGPATSASLKYCDAVTVDSVGNLYIADTSNYCIRKVDHATGEISTVAGIGTQQGHSGDGGPATSAELGQTRGVAVDSSGNLYISDYGNARIREVDATTGIISDVMGIGVQPEGIAVDSNGNLYIPGGNQQKVYKYGPAANSTVSPTTASFDKDSSNTAAGHYADVPVTMTLNGNTFSSISNGPATLNNGLDYSVNGNTVTLKKEYLATQSVGTTTLNFNFSAGNAQTLVLTVIDSTVTLITSSNANVTINHTGKKITYPMYTIDGTNFAQLANIKSVLSAASGYTYEIYEADGTTVAPAMDVTNKLKVLQSGNVVETYTFVAYIKYGDVNGDGEINTSDLVLLARYLVNSTSYPLPKVYGTSAADINKDRTVNSSDKVLLQRYLINTQKYPIESPTEFLYPQIYAY